MMPDRVTRMTCVYWPCVTSKCSARDQTPSLSGTHSRSSAGQTSGTTRAGRMSSGWRPRYGAAVVSRLVTSTSAMALLRYCVAVAGDDGGTSSEVRHGAGDHRRTTAQEVQVASLVRLQDVILVQAPVTAHILALRRRPSRAPL